MSDPSQKDVPGDRIADESKEKHDTETDWEKKDDPQCSCEKKS